MKPARPAPSSPSAGRSPGAWAAAGRIVLLYALFGILWILFSDTLVLKLFRDPEDIRVVSIFKGWAFILVTAVMLYALIARHFAQLLQKEAALALSDRRFREALRSARHLMYRLDAKAGRYDYLSPSVEALTGFPIEEYAGFGMRQAMERFHPEDRARVEAILEDAARSGGPEGRSSAVLEYRFLRKDGRYAWFEDWTTATFDAAGGLESFVGVVYDITDRKEREEQLRQAQKMETVGRLAGGVAHDFNNLLTVILGECSLASRETPKGSPLQGRLAGIRDAGQRAASLTRQLLAFSRKQVLEPRVIDPNRALLGVEGILRRVIGEQIALEISLSPDVRNVEADPGQLAQVVINLAVNARDAMPGGGRLRIGTGNVESDGPLRIGEEEPLPAGRYVCISVSDNGSGMSDEVRRMAFDPFFTTKEVGKGTGLGLSMAYGIVAQSRGRIGIESRPGGGTTVRIYLPEASGAPATEEEGERPPPGPGSGTILVVEDEAPVRRLMLRILEEHGYRVSEAEDGVEGLRLLAGEGEPYDLLVADLAMPRMGGAELAARARAARPGIRVLFVTGYAALASMPGEGTPSDSAFLRKPFEPDAFVETVQRLLRREGGVSSAEAGAPRRDP